MLLSFQNSQVEQVRVAAAPHQSHLLEPKSPNWGPKLPCLKNVKLSRRGFLLKQEEFCLELVAEMARISKGERALAAENQQRGEPLLRWTPHFYRSYGQSNWNCSSMRTIQEEVPYSKQGDPCNFILRGPHSLSAPTASELRRETIELLRQQNALQLQQNRIVELLALNQNRRKLPQLSVPVFDGNPIGYRTFARANESLIESRTFSSTDRLYYLEQFMAGDVQELVRSCHLRAPKKKIWRWIIHSIRLRDKSFRLAKHKSWG